jgi:hypothetical protein
MASYNVPAVKSGSSLIVFMVIIGKLRSDTLGADSAEQKPRVTALRKAQEDKCGSCGVRLTALPAGKGSGWCIDHDHKTGRVRGILCHRCNLLIGMGLDDPDLLRAAASYLERQSNCTAIEQKTKAIG